MGDPISLFYLNTQMVVSAILGKSVIIILSSTTKSFILHPEIFRVHFICAYLLFIIIILSSYYPSSRNLPGSFYVCIFIIYPIIYIHSTYKKDLVNVSDNSITSLITEDRL